MTDFRKISDNTYSDAVIVLRGLGTQGGPHPEFTSFLVGTGLEVYYYNRDGDVLLKKVGAIETYCREIHAHIASLVASKKRVHLIGISFGGFLSIEVVGDVKNAVSSIVAIAPLIDPYTTVMNISETSSNFAHVKLARDLELSILCENISSLRDWRPKEVLLPGIVIMGDKDEFECVENLDRITGKEVTKHILPGVRHESTTGHPETQRLIREFYSKILLQTPI